MDYKFESLSKKLSAFLVVIFACLVAGAQSSVQFNFANGQYVTSQYTNVQVVLQPEQLNVSGGVTLGTPQIYQTTDANASTTFSNLYGSYTGGYYRWVVPAFTSPNGFNPPNTISGDIQVTATNLGTVQSTTIGVVFVPVYSGSGAAWTAQASDLRYSPSAIVTTNFVLNTTLISTSNSLVAQIVASTNGMTSIVYSNPGSYATPTFVSNVVTALASTNFPAGTTLTTITNIAYQQATNQGAFGTNFSLSVSNGLLAYAQSVSNLMLFLKQPASTILTNLSNTGAFTNTLLAGANVSFSTNGSSSVITISATNQVFLTNGLGPWVGLLPSSFLQTNALPQLTNGFVTIAITNGLATIQYVNSLIASGSNTNQYSPGQNVTFTTNVSGSITTINATNQTFLTNGLAVWSSVVPSQFLQTNSLPGLTNGFVGSGITNGFLTTNGAYALYYPTSNPSAFVAATVTNGLATTNFVLSVIPSFTTNGLINGQIATNSFDATNTATQVANALKAIVQPANAYLTNLSGTGANTNIYLAGLNMFITTNVSGTIQSFGSSNQTFLTNGMLAQYATTNQNNIWYDTNGAAAWGYTNAVNVSTNYANTNTSAQIAAFAASLPTNTTLPFVLSTNGIAHALTIADSLVFGFAGSTNMAVNTNWIRVGSCGSPGAKGDYFQYASGLWTNTSFTGFNGLSIVFSGGTYSLLNTNGQTLYLTNSVNGQWLVGPSGTAPTPYASFGAPLQDAILPGLVTSTNLQSQWLFALGEYVPTNTAASNYIASIVLTLASSPTNGITSIQASNIVANYGSTLFLGTNLTGWSATASNAVIFDVTNNSTVYSLFGGGGGGGANVSLNNINNTGTNVIASIATNFFALQQMTNIAIGNGGGGSNPQNFWLTNGNNAPAGSVLGPTNPIPLQLVAGGNVASFTTPQTTRDVRIVMGFSNNIAADSVSISNRNSAILSGQNNYIAGVAFNDPSDGRGDVIVGGDSNTNTSTGFGYIGTGFKNTLSSYSYETIVNGASNKVQSVDSGLVVAGDNNLVFQTSPIYAGLGYGHTTIVNGIGNINNGVYGFIGNGISNIITTGAAQTPYSPVILDGYDNMISNSTPYATILNGSHNLIANTNGTPFLNTNGSGTLIVGSTNTIMDGTNVYVFGTRNSISDSQNIFAFNDGTSVLGNTLNNQFIVQATGGAEFQNTPVDSTVGFSVNGIPIPGGTTIITNVNNYSYSSGTNVISGVYFFSSNTVASGIVLNTNSPIMGKTNAISYMGGLYISATNNNAYYTNIFGYAYITPNSVYPSSPLYLIATGNVANPTLFPELASATPSGTFYGTAVPISQGIAGSVSFSNLISTFVQMSVNTNSPGTNTLYVLGSVGVRGDVVATNFIGSGTGLNNIQLSAMPAQVLTNMLPMPNGTNDMTSVIQPLLWSNNVVFFQPNQIYYVTNLVAGDGVSIFGNGATLKQLATSSQVGYATNQFWAFASSNLNAIITESPRANVNIRDLIFDGNTASNYLSYAINPYTSINSGFTLLGLQHTPFYLSNWGLLADESGGGIVENCWFQNFSGGGAELTSSKDQLSYTIGWNWIGNTESNNFCGLYVQSQGGLNAGNLYGNCEYATLISDHAVHNTLGIDCGASNTKLVLSDIDDNQIGANFTGGNGNSGPHGYHSDITMNHNVYGFWIGSVDYLQFNSLYEAATATNIIHNITGGMVVFNNSSVSSIWIANEGAGFNTNSLVTFLGGAALNIYDTSNNIDFESSRLSSFVIVTNAFCYANNCIGWQNNYGSFVPGIISGATAQIIGSGNHPYNQTNSDLGNVYVGGMIGNGSGLTNLANSVPSGSTTNLLANIGGSGATVAIPWANLPIGSSGAGNASTNSTGYQIWTGGTNLFYGTILGSNSLNTVGYNLNTNGNANFSGSITASNLAQLYYIQTNFISGVKYINTNAFQARVGIGSTITAGTSVGNVAGFQLWFDPAGGTAWQTNDDGTTISAIGTLAMTTHYKLQGVIPGGGSFVFTNLSSGGTATLIPNTGQISAP